MIGIIIAVGVAGLCVGMYVGASNNAAVNRAVAALEALVKHAETLASPPKK